MVLLETFHTAATSLYITNHQGLITDGDLYGPNEFNESKSSASQAHHIQ